MPRPRAMTSTSNDSENEQQQLRAPSALKGKGRDSSGPLQRGSAWCVQLDHVLPPYIL